MIREAQLKDFEEVFVLLKQLFYQDRLSKKKTCELYQKSLTNKNTIVLVLVENTKIRGFASIIFREDMQSQGKIGYLSELVIDENSRGKGFGTLLLKEIMRQSRKTGCVEIQFPSTFERKNAHKFYESLGFNKTAYFFWKELK